MNRCNNIADMSIDNFDNMTPSELNNFYRQRILLFLDDIKNLCHDINGSVGTERNKLLNRIKFVNDFINDFNKFIINQDQKPSDQNPQDLDNNEYSDIEKNDKELENDSDTEDDVRNHQIEYDKFKTLLNDEFKKLYLNSIAHIYTK